MSKISYEKAEELKELLEKNGFLNEAEELQRSLEDRNISLGELYRWKHCDSHISEFEDYIRDYKAYCVSQKDKKKKRKPPIDSKALCIAAMRDSSLSKEAVEYTLFTFASRCRCKKCGMPMWFEDIDIEELIKRYENNVSVSVEFSISDYYKTASELLNELHCEIKMSDLERQLCELKKRISESFCDDAEITSKFEQIEREMEELKSGQLV